MDKAAANVWIFVRECDMDIASKDQFSSNGNGYEHSRSDLERSREREQDDR